MATTTDRRSYPNDYFSWYNDDDRMAIVWVITDADSTEGQVAGEYDTYDGSTVSEGIRITYHSRYLELNNVDNDINSVTGLPEGLFPCLISYVKARLYEDIGDMQKAAYYRQMFMRMYSKYPLRKSGVRQLSVPKL